jgi:hypothetical protein
MKRTKTIVLAIFIIAVGLRFVLAVINREANDYHMEVINQMVDKHKIPQREDCWECFQPKFFYIISAGIIKVFNVQKIETRIIIIQFFNAILGFLSILFHLKKPPAWQVVMY